MYNCNDKENTSENPTAPHLANKSLKMKKMVFYVRFMLYVCTTSFGTQWYDQIPPMLKTRFKHLESKHPFSNNLTVAHVLGLPFSSFFYSSESLIVIGSEKEAP